MTHTSWDRADIDAPRLLIGDGPEELGVFRAEEAVVDGHRWSLSTTQTNATATTDAGEKFVLDGNRKRADELNASLNGEDVRFVAEGAKNWVVFDAAGAKLAQFSAADRGVRRSIVEFDRELPHAQTAAVSYFARLILEARLGGYAVALIATLLLLTIAGLVTFLI